MPPHTHPPAIVWQADTSAKVAVASGATDKPIDVVLARKLGGGRSKRPTDWHVQLGIERVADLMFVGLTVGTASAGRYNAEGRDR
jgi:hypothetical protein